MKLQISDHWSRVYGSVRPQVRTMKVFAAFCLILAAYYSGWANAWGPVWILISIGVFAILSPEVVAISGAFLYALDIPVLVHFGFVVGENVAAAGTYCLLLAMAVTVLSKITVQLSSHNSPTLCFSIESLPDDRNITNSRLGVLALSLAIIAFGGVANYTFDGNRATLQRLQEVSANARLMFASTNRFGNIKSMLASNILRSHLSRDIKIRSGNYPSSNPSEIELVGNNVGPNNSIALFSLSRSGVCYGVMQIMSTKIEMFVTGEILPRGSYYIRIEHLRHCGWNQDSEIFAQAASWNTLSSSH